MTTLCSLSLPANPNPLRRYPTPNPSEQRVTPGGIAMQEQEDAAEGEGRGREEKPSAPALTDPTAAAAAAAPMPPRFRSVVDYPTEAALRAALAGSPWSGNTDAPLSRPLSASYQGTRMPPCVIDGLLHAADWDSNVVDAPTSHAGLEEEVQRLMELKHYSVLDSDPNEAKFERFTALGSRMFDVPICLVSLVDIGRQWFKSNRGLGEVRETSREVSFCAHAILSTHDVFIVEDTALDPRFASNGLVTGAPHIRFYAGVPLVTPNGHKLGTFCIIDDKPRPGGLTPREKQNLRDLTEMVMDTLVYRKRENEQLLDEKNRLIACAAHDLLSPLTGIQLSLGLLMEDKELSARMDGHQRELIEASVECSAVMERICVQAIQNFRGDLARADSARKGRSSLPSATPFVRGDSNRLVNMDHFIHSIERVIGIYPKKVPFFIEKSDDLPPAIVCDDLKLFRSVLNYLTNACKHTQAGTIRLKIYVRKGVATATPVGSPNNAKKTAPAAPKPDALILEVHDTGPGIDTVKYPTLFAPLPASAFRNKGGAQELPAAQQNHHRTADSGLGLYSVATEIGSLGGEYGVFPRQNLLASHASDCHVGGCSNVDRPPGNSNQEMVSVSGCVFWISVPLVLPVAETTAALTTTAASIGRKSSSTPTLNTGIRRLEMNTAKSNAVFGDFLDQVKPMPPRTIAIPPRPASAKDAMKRSFNTALVPRKTKATLDMTSGENVGSDNAANPSQPQLPLLKKNKRTRRVLIIDDSVTIRKGLARGFSRLGFEVAEAENGLQGLEKLKANCYELVLLDFLMPVMDGPEAASKFREWEREHRADFHQHIIGISAHAHGKDAETGIKAGMDRFMAKPVPLKSLKDIAQCRPVIEASRLLDSKFEQSYKKPV